MSKFAPHEALKLIAWGESTFDEKVVLHRVGRAVCRKIGSENNAITVKGDNLGPEPSTLTNFSLFP